MIPLATSILLSAAIFAAPAQPTPAGPVSPWPRVIPARVLTPDEAAADDLLVFTLGEVQTPIANARFDPTTDTLTFNDARRIEHYYRDSLGIRAFTPIDKSRFPVPVSGWCTWYNYYTDLTAADVLENARWIAAHLKDYGLSLVQLDDAWQGAGHGLGDNRDWTTINARFNTPQHPGLAALVKDITDLGLTPGLWIVPQGQSNPAIAAANDVFLKRPDGTPISEGWVGTYVLDPTAPGTPAYLKALLAPLRQAGYTFFKTDGFPPTIDLYEKNLESMRALPTPGGKAPTDPAARRKLAEDLFASLLPPIREAIGPESYWLGCWGIALPSIGHVNGGRTAGDVKISYDGWLVSMIAKQEWAFLHNIAWYNDPDTVLVRQPLSDGLARSWATAQGLCGQALLASDRMMDLPHSRVELLKRIFPATDVRPLDLFKPGAARKHIWNLKVNHPSVSGSAPLRTADIVGVFNFEPATSQSRLVSWKALGLDPAQPHHVFDFWGGTYLGAWEHGLFVEVPPADARLLAIVPMEPRPVLMSTSRHVTQGWVDLLSLRTTGSGTSWTVEGESRLVGGEEYELAFGLPRSPESGPMLEITGFEATGAMKAVSTTFRVHQGWAAAGLWNDTTQTVTWKATFGPARNIYTRPVFAEGVVTLEPNGLSEATARFGVQWQPTAGHQIALDGQILGVAQGSWAQLRGLEPGRTFHVEQRPIWWDGRRSENAVGGSLTIPVPEKLFLSDIAPISARQGWGTLRMDRSIDGNGLRVGGRAFAKGLGTHAASEIVYPVIGKLTRFRGVVGVDDEVPVEKAGGRAFVFEVVGDGVVLWSSPALRRGDAGVEVDVALGKSRRLELRVRAEPASAGIDWGHVDWGEARLER